MSKADVTADVRAARARLADAIAGLSEEQMVYVGAVGIWSVKDMLAHLVAWEAELVTALSSIEQHKRRPPRIIQIEDIDEWNAEQYRVNAARPVINILEDFHGVHRQLLLAIDALSEEQLDDNLLWPWMEGEPLSYLIAETAVWHEEEHADDIVAWREQRGL